MPSFTLIKDRLDQRLKQSDLCLVKEALYAYLAKEDPDLLRTKINDFSYVDLIPYLQDLSPLWEGFTEEDFITTYPAILSFYQCVRGQF